MNEDTVCLLKECNAGCKSATNSMEQIQPYVHDDKLKSLLDRYNDEHIHIGDRCHELLNEGGEDEKDPHPAAKVFSWISTEVKLAVDGSERQVADLLIDGCNMGIKSVGKYLNQYPAASNESIQLAQKLIRTEQGMMGEMISFL